jgi:hypothetical protein
MCGTSDRLFVSYIISKIVCPLKYLLVSPQEGGGGQSSIFCTFSCIYPWSKESASLFDKMPGLEITIKMYWIIPTTSNELQLTTALLVITGLWHRYSISPWQDWTFPGGKKSKLKWCKFWPKNAFCMSFSCLFLSSSNYFFKVMLFPFSEVWRMKVHMQMLYVVRTRPTHKVHTEVLLQRGQWAATKRRHLSYCT